jgi:hypothetical protein
VNGTSPPVTFDFDTWVAMFPEFAALTPGQGQAYFYRASGLCANSCSNPMFGDGVLPYRLYLLTSHFAWLSCPRDDSGNPAATGQPASALVGRISSATEGSVTVQTELEMGSDTSAWEAELTQTKYGLEYLAKLAPYRTAVYLANPTVVLNGLLGVSLPGRFFPRR